MPLLPGPANFCLPMLASCCRDACSRGETVACCTIEKANVAINKLAQDGRLGELQGRRRTPVLATDADSSKLT